MKTDSAQRFRPAVEQLEAREVPAFLAPITSNDGGVSAAVGDFNHDGRDDVAALRGAIVTSQPGNSGTWESVALGNKTNVTVSLSNGDGTFQKPIALKGAQGDYVQWFEASDRNNDGHLDVVVLGITPQRSPWLPAATSYLNVWFGKGDGTFSSVTTTVGSTLVVGLFNPMSVGADLNGDGITDQATVDGISNVVTVSLGNPDGTYQSPLAFPVKKTPGSIAVGDFNGDGWIDIVLMNDRTSNQPTFSVLFNDGSW